MSNINEIPKGGDFDRPITYKVNDVATTIALFTNYGLKLYYKDGTLIKKLSKNVVTADTDYVQWLFANNEAGGIFDLKLRRELTIDLKEGEKIYGQFEYQIADTEFDSDQKRVLESWIVIGIVVKGSTLVDLTT